MGARVAGVLVGVGLCVLGVLIMVGALQEAYAPVDSGVQGGCTQYLPHYDHVTEGEFHGWVYDMVGEHTNVEYEYGVWYADGVIIGYAGAEDGPIYNSGECV